MVGMNNHAPNVSARVTFMGQVPDASEVIDIGQIGEKLEVVSDRKVKFNHEFATWLLELPEFIVNDATVDRALRDAHVQYLNWCMKSGTFRPEWVNIITCECLEQLGANPHSSEFRMNGQHTAWACLEMPGDYAISVRHLKYKSATVADMRILYASIDRGAPRSAGNVINAYLAGSDGFESASAKIIQLIASGFAMWQWGSDWRKSEKVHSVDDVAVMLQTDFKDLAVKVKNWLVESGRSQSNRSMFFRAPVVAALYETFGKLPGKAAEFWDAVRDGVGMEDLSDPRLRLRDKLAHSSVNIGAGRNGNKKAIDGETMYRLSLSAWNAWRKGDKIQILKASKTDNRPKAK